MSPNIDTNDQKRGTQFRIISFASGALIWLASIWLLFANWLPGNYLALELAWALPPILLQLGFGGDILWKYRRLVLWSLLPTVIYLCIGDAIAIGSGTWTINPERSTGILIGNLPIEEIIFFLITNVLVVFGLILFPARESHQRVPPNLREQLYKWFGPPRADSL